MIYPCIDLQDGEVVQLIRGQNKGTEIVKNYEEMTEIFADADLTINVIDLDAAKDRGNNLDKIKYILQNLEARVGGGVRNAEQAEKLIDLGAKKVIVGTSAFDSIGINYKFLADLESRVGKEKIIVALDTWDGKIAVKGWRESLDIDPLLVVSGLEEYCSEIQCTYVDKEGMMQGTDMNLFRVIRERTNITLTAAGGISTLKEIENLEYFGANSVIGMAFYTGKISLEDVIKYNQLDFVKSCGYIETRVQNLEGLELYPMSTSRESLRKTNKTGTVWRFSKSQNRLLEVGSESGKTEYVKRILTNCYGDNLLYMVEQEKEYACHLGYRTCFFREMNAEGFFEINQERVIDPKEMYGGKNEGSK